MSEERIRMLEAEIQELRESVLQLERRQLYPTFLNCDELASMLNIKLGTVYDWVSKKKIPFHKAGDRTIFSLEEILKWTKKQANDNQSNV